MKTAGVIGANSMLGAQLMSSLVSMGVEVISIGRYAKADIQLDLKKGFLSPLPPHARADIIFHCAASFADDSSKGIRENFEINTAGCLWVLELAEYLGCTAIVYAGSVSSMATLEPGKFMSYGFTKAQAEELLAWGIQRRHGRFCSLRFSQIYDTAGTCLRHQLWFGRIIAYAARGIDINMPGSDGVRNFLHLDDAVRMMVAAGQSSADGVLPIVHPESLTYKEIATAAYTIFGKGGHVVLDPNKTPFRPIHFPDAAHSFHLLHHTPAISISEGMARIRDQKTWPAFGPLDVT